MYIYIFNGSLMTSDNHQNKSATRRNRSPIVLLALVGASGNCGPDFSHPLPLIRI